MWSGKIKGSRTLDSIALSQIVDGIALGFLAYSPEQLGITIPVYATIRIIIHALQAYLRHDTTGPLK